MVYIKLTQKEKPLLSRLKTKYLEFSDDFYVSLKDISASVDYLNEQDKKHLNSIITSKNRIVFKRTLEKKRKVL